MSEAFVVECVEDCNSRDWDWDEFFSMVDVVIAGTLDLTDHPATVEVLLCKFDEKQERKSFPRWLNNTYPPDDDAARTRLHGHLQELFAQIPADPSKESRLLKDMFCCCNDNFFLLAWRAETNSWSNW